MADKAMRYDRAELRSPVRTPQGFLRVEGFVSRAGIYEYRNDETDAKNGYGAAGTIRRELRPEEEVAREDALAGYEGAPLTARHPKQMISANNARAYEIGTSTQRGRYDTATKRVAAAMVIKDPATIAKVESGELNELSPGYKATIVKQSGADKRYGYAGNPEGRYDCIQRDIEINHLALVEGARGGSDLRIRMDGVDDVALEHRTDNDLTAAARKELSASEFADPDQRKFPIENEAHVRDAMSRFADADFPSAAVRKSTFHRIVAAAHKFGIETKGFEQAHRMDAADERHTMTLEEQVRALKLQLDDANKTLAERKDSLDTATTERDAANGKIKTLGEEVENLKAKLAAGSTAMETKAITEHAARADAAEAKLKKLEDSRTADIRRASELRLKAQVVMGAEFRCDGKTDRDIQIAVIKRFQPREDIGEAQSDAYVASRFDSLVEAHMQNARSLTRAGEVLAGGGGDRREARVDSREAREKAWSNRATDPKGYRAAFGLDKEEA